MMRLGKEWVTPDMKPPLVHDDLWWEAREWAEEHASEEGTFGYDYDEEMIDAWQEKHYEWLCEQEGIEPYIYE